MKKLTVKEQVQKAIDHWNSLSDKEKNADLEKQYKNITKYRFQNATSLLESLALGIELCD